MPHGVYGYTDTFKNAITIVQSHTYRKTFTSELLC